MAGAVNGHNPIPVVDLSPFQSGISEKSKEAAQSFTNACHRLGFVYITGHGVPEELLDEAFAWSKKLYELDHEEKMKAPHPTAPMPHRGYSPPGLEKIAEYADNHPGDAAVEKKDRPVKKVGEFKESYEIGSESNPNQPNIWLPEDVLPGFRDFMTNFYWELNKPARLILQAVCQGLDLTKAEADNLLRIHSGHNNQLRLLHYPPVAADLLENQVTARMPAHRDWSAFTMLFQDDCGGLELEDPQEPGRFLMAAPIPGTLVLNIGDMLQRLSNDTFQSANHRVQLPPFEDRFAGEKRITRARYSIPYFVAPDDTAVVESFPSRVDEAHPAKYEPVAFQDYGALVAKHLYDQAPATTAVH